MVENSEMKHDLNQTISYWDKNAAIWDEAMGEGSPFQKELLEPHTLKFLDIKAGQKVLDIACGNGQMSRVLARLGAKVTAIDASPTMVKLAQSRNADLAIDYRIADITKTQPGDLEGHPFDAVLCNMALMDIEDIKPVFEVAYKVLKDTGIFVFSVNHPCYDKSAATHLRETYDQNGVLITETCLKVREYLKPTSLTVKALPTFSSVHYFFHRPLQTYLNVAFEAGFLMCGIAEQGFPENTTLREHKGWHELPQIPVVFIAKFKK